MKTNVRIAVITTAVYIVAAWVLLPAGASWLWGRSSLVRFDPKVSKDYNCIFVEGHIAKRFTVPWLSNHTPLDYLRIRYTPNDDKQQYGIMFIDPRTLAYEAHDYCAPSPLHLSGRLDSSAPIFDWMRSQPHSTESLSHTNDSQEIFAAIRSLTSCDLEHFALPADFPLKNFANGHQALATSDKPNWGISCLILLLVWIPVISRKRKPDIDLMPTATAG